jgi:SpoVK/Ycf46/Vps4 family AAA+-type ATPase
MKIINTGYMWIDVAITILIATLMFSQSIGRVLERCWNRIIARFNYVNKIVLCSFEKETSKRFKAVMHYISKTNDPTIKTLREIVNKKYNRRVDEYEETKVSIYRVDQPLKFNITINIEGRVYMIDKERAEYNGKTVYDEMTCLEIFSSKIGLTDLEEWIEEKLNEHNDYLRSKSCDKQSLIEISWNPKEQEIDVYNNPWESNATFDNRFFTDKTKILDKINFFINNPKWYKERGIPYTIGFLLWGEPGCGKTGFIKALMNLTKRHGVAIKLNNKFDLNKLREIVYNDEISEDIIISQKDRIIIFEDIDCMSEITKDRNIKDKESDELLDDSDERVIKKTKKNKQSDNDDMLDTTCVSTILNINATNNYNNNLSFLLNILDGLQESPGRIIIMTTNKPEQLDKALVRPGRIDHNINFTKATTQDVKEILEFYWDEPVEFNDIQLNMKYSHAEIINFCRTSDTISETINKLL